MANFRDFLPSPGWEELPCEGPECQTPVEYCVGHEEISDVDMPNGEKGEGHRYMIYFVCKDHLKTYREEIKEHAKEDGVKTRFFFQKLK